VTLVSVTMIWFDKRFRQAAY